MSFNKRIAFTNKYNQQVLVRSVGVGDDCLEVNATDNPALAKYFTDREHTMRVCRLIDEALGVRTRLEDRTQVYIITKVKRDCDEYLQAIVKGAGELPTPIWTKVINNALEFDSFDSMTIMCNFIDSLRENDCQAKCGHQMFYK
ncbi:hypothetical protein R1S95_003049 [Listeria monocytogenes]|nr:hypothetical protein [Listeria monocytogenes]EJE4827378.1 hypothetical protein [Listeria monocytogenes]EJF9325516.1 hypothetical protein [Listeria monocytogenes]EJF9328643.1 hypothetical protein [Listeria monocytogenes]ELP1224199.1 hypothetical protein [Listeria monocytogenes]